MKILIIEDTAANMRLLSDLLRREGHTVLEARDAIVGLRLAEEKQPDFILMDVHLPGMDGLTAARALKKSELTRHIPITAVTAHAMAGDEESILLSGCNHYIQKPIRYKAFLEHVNTVQRTLKKMNDSHD